MKRNMLVMAGVSVALLGFVVFGAQEKPTAETVTIAPPKMKQEAPKAIEVAKTVEKPSPIVTEQPAKPAVAPVKIEAPKVETTTVLPDGKILIENKKVTLRYPNGKTEERYVKITATPVQKPMKKTMRKGPQ